MCMAGQTGKNPLINLRLSHERFLSWKSLIAEVAWASWDALLAGNLG